VQQREMEQGPVRLGTYRRRAGVILKWWMKDAPHGAASNQLVQAFLPHAEAVKLARKELMELYARMEGMQRAVDKASSAILQAASQVPPLVPRASAEMAHRPSGHTEGYLGPTHIRRLGVRLDRVVQACDAAAGSTAACVAFAVKALGTPRACTRSVRLAPRG